MQVVPFLIVNVIFFGFSAVYKPLLQAMIGMFGTKENQGIHVGIYNSLSAVGTVVGSLTAGFVYGLGSYGPRLSFALSAAAFLAAMILAWVMAKKRRQAAGAA
jgi:DHA1 family multidrug resistance protein-like MFS transporter